MDLSHGATRAHALMDEAFGLVPFDMSTRTTQGVSKGVKILTESATKTHTNTHCIEFVQLCSPVSEIHVPLYFHPSA